MTTISSSEVGAILARSLLTTLLTALNTRSLEHDITGVLKILQTTLKILGNVARFGF